MRSATIAMVAFLLTWSSMVVVPAQSQETGRFKIEVIEQPPPKELTKPILAVLAPSAIRLLDDGKVFYEFWFRKEIPLTARPDPDTFSLLAASEGTLFGALKVHDERYDFKDEEIPPGVYTLRFALQPQDGDHLGTSPTQTFALLVPAKDDKAIDAFSDRDELSDASSTINAAKHPSNLNFQRVSNEGKGFPRLASNPRKEWELVCIRLKGSLKNGKESIPLTFALVFDGVGKF